MKRRAIPSVLILSVVLGSQLSAQNNPSFSGAWDVRSPGEWDPARLVISQTDASITITASGGLGGIVLGTSGYLFDDWDPASRSAVVTPADIDAFRARAEMKKVLAKLPVEKYL